MPLLIKSFAGDLKRMSKQMNTPNFMPKSVSNIISSGFKGV